MDRNTEERSGSGGGMAFIIILLALVLIVGPLVVPERAVHVSGAAQLVSALFGVALLLVGSVMIAFTSFYVKASSNTAFVRTGMGGPKVVLDGGALVVPQIHFVRRVSLETVKLVVERSGKDALITGDNLRADIRAEFYIRVNRTEDSVKNAATTLGDKSGNDQAIMELVGEKLISAMRTVAARSDLEHLHSQLDQYREEVKKIVEHDLEPNGLFLETVAVSHLNQTNPEHLSPDTNVFDAQGLKKISAITAQQRIERSKIQTAADQTVKEQEVARDQALFALDVKQQTASAERDAQIKRAQAEQEREAAEFVAGQRQLSEIAEVTATRTVDIANVEKEQATKVAEQKRDSAAQQASIERERNVEVSKREQAIAVAEAETRRATAEQARISAETERERANQALLTVGETQKAERQKNITVINKQAEAETTRIARNMEADVAAYGVTKSAEAEQDSATRRAAAIRTMAEANKEARMLEAEGEQAFQIVPVNVAGKQVEVEQAQVVVTRTRLEAETANQRMAFDLQVEIARINADRDVRIEQAKAFGVGLAASKMTLYGDPTTFARMLGSFGNGQVIGQYVRGVMDQTPGVVTEAALEGLSNFSAAAARALESLTGKKMTPDEVEALIRQHLVNSPATPTVAEV